MNPAVLAQLATTLPLSGLIWFVQVAHYPLFSRVGADAFPDYHAAYTARISILVGPLMAVEAGAAAWLAFAPPPGVPRAATAAGLGLVAVIWGSTAALQVPEHRRLSSGFSRTAAARLVETNWIRTASWTARGTLALWMAAGQS